MRRRRANAIKSTTQSAAHLRSLLGQASNSKRKPADGAGHAAIGLVIAKAGGSLEQFSGLDAALASVTKLDKATFATAAVTRWSLAAPPIC